MACQTSRNVCGITLLLLSYMWLKRRGCFLRTFTRGLDFSGLAALPAGWEEREEMENREGWLGVSKGLFFQFIGPPHTHPLTPTHTHTQATEPRRQSQDVTSSTGRQAKQLFLSLLCCLCCWVKLEPLGLLVVGGSRGARGGRAAGAVLHRETEVKGSAGWTSHNFPPHSSAVGFQQVQCTLSTLY